MHTSAIENLGMFRDFKFKSDIRGKWCAGIIKELIKGIQTENRCDEVKSSQRYPTISNGRVVILRDETSVSLLGILAITIRLMVLPRSSRFPFLLKKILYYFTNPGRSNYCFINPEFILYTVGTCFRVRIYLHSFWIGQCNRIKPIISHCWVMPQLWRR